MPLLGFQPGLRIDVYWSADIRLIEQAEKALLDQTGRR